MASLRILRNDEPLVSIVIPIYNDASVVTDALESALGQKYGNLEVILVNDGSTDDVEAVTEKYRRDPRCKYVKQENAGLSAARNTGLAHAKGTYILFLDADDILVREAIAKGVDFLNRNHEYDIVYFDFCAFKDDKKSELFYFSNLGYPTGVILDYLFLRGHHFNTSRVLLKRSLLENIKFETGKFSEDWDLWIALSYYKKARFGHLSEVLVHLRMRTTSLSRGAPGRLRAAQGTLMLFKKWKGILPEDLKNKYNIDMKIDVLAFKYAVALLQVKGKKDATAFLRETMFSSLRYRSIMPILGILIKVTPIFVENSLLNYYYSVKTKTVIKSINE